ncbi:MAG: hypothetical protein ACXWUB_12725, partial [Burkholderiales bacterium]
RNDRRRAQERQGMSANLTPNVHATGHHKAVPAFQRLRLLLGDYASPCRSRPGIPGQPRPV